MLFCREIRLYFNIGINFLRLGEIANFLTTFHENQQYRTVNGVTV